MEKEGLERCLEKMNGCGLIIDILATDRHPQIASFMRKTHPEINHQYDVWHMAKNIAKKLAKKAKVASCRDLTRWIPSITNHLWWSAATCSCDPILLKEKWTSIIHHIVNIHSWTGNEKFHRCAHPDHREPTKKLWLQVGSPSHQAVKAVVLNDKLIKDMGQLTLLVFCHTGTIEVYHAMLTKYCPKREHFSYKGMTARLQLAVLDHNSNHTRKQATTKTTGQERFKLVHPKSKKEWVIKPIYERKDYRHLKELMIDTISMREEEPRESKLKGRQATKPQVELQETIAKVAKPNKAEAITKHRSRLGFQS